ncbi:MAG: bacillithiol biosynthesis cysteine-adding enzyme BshC [bacterium]
MKISPNELPGANKLFRDYIVNFDLVEKFYNIPFQDEKAIASHIEIVGGRNYPAEALAKILTQQNKNFGASNKTYENIEKLKEGRAFVVITGQQVGLFGGPMYVLYKALTVIKLADRWSRLFEKCFVPVFWLAADDSDFEEVNHISFLNKDSQNTTTQIEKTLSGNIPMAQMRIGEQINETLDELANGLHDTEFKSDILESLRSAYHSEASLSEAFGCWMMHLLKDFGLIIIDPTHSRIKTLVSQIFIEEIREKSPSTRAVLQTSKALNQKGYTPQVPLREGRLNLFYLDNQRKPLEFINDKVQTTDGGSTFSHGELLEVARTKPERFSPNVVLRALTQDTLFPTIAYVAGPSEICYFAQLKGVYEHFQIPMPVIYPLKSLTIVEPAIDRIIDKFNLKINDIWGNIDQHIVDIARQSLPETLTNMLSQIKSEWPLALQALHDDVRSVDPTLLRMLENTGGKIVNTIDRLEKKIIQAGQRKNEVARQQLNKAASAIYPNHALQERVHNFTPYLIKYGPLFVERIYELLDIGDYHHQIVRL